MTYAAKYISKALLKAEKQLAELLAEAASVQDHDTVEEIRSAGIQLRALRLKYHDGEKVKVRPKPKPVPKKNRPRFEVRDANVTSMIWDRERGTSDIKTVPKSSFDATIIGLEAMTKLRSGAHAGGDIVEQVQRRCDHGVHSAEVRKVLAILEDHGMVVDAGADRFHVPSNIGPLVKKALARPLRG